MSKKFWRSGMIDKKVVKEREEAEYINKLERVILELTREEEEPKYATIYTSDNRSFKREIPREKLLTPTQSAKKCGEDIAKLFINDYDEIKHGDNITLEFTDGCILTALRDSISQALLDFNKQFITKSPKTPVKDAIFDSYSYWIRKNADKRCDTDIEFGRKIEALENESNTRTL